MTDSQKVTIFAQNSDQVTIFALLASYDNLYFDHQENLETRVKRCTSWLSSDKNTLHYGDCTKACGSCHLCCNLALMDQTQELIRECREAWKDENLSDKMLHRQIVARLLSIDPKSFFTFEAYIDQPYEDNLSKTKPTVSQTVVDQAFEITENCLGEMTV